MSRSVSGPAGLLHRALRVGLIATLATSRVAAQGRSFDLQFGVVQPQHEALRQWVAASPVLKAHLQWLGQQLDLPVAIPVIFTSCGQANAFFRPDLTQITMCFEWIEQRRDQVQNRAQEGEKLTDAVLRGIEHVLNHETGHAAIHVLHLPVLGREEDAADGFSAFLLLDRGHPLDAYSVLQGALANQGSFLTDDQADEHSLGKQRFFNLLCWLYGSDSARFAGFARQGALPEHRLQRCSAEWAQLQRSWSTVLGSHLKTKPVTSPSSLAPQVIAIASAQRVSIAAGSAWTARFQLPTATCRLSLDVTGVDGGQLDLVTMVLDDYNFLNWQAKRAGVYWEATFRSGRERHTVADVPLQGPGRYALVVSNDFSLLTPKTAQITGRAICS